MDLVFNTTSSPLIKEPTFFQSGGGGTSLIQGIVSNDTSLITTGLDAATGGLFSGANNILTSVTGFDIVGNLSNVLGTKDLSNWNASTNPTHEMNITRQHVMPLIQAKLQSINSNNVGQVLTWVDGFIQFMIAGNKHLLEHHTRASQTREAYTKVNAFLATLRLQFIAPILKQLKDSGLTVSTQNVTKDFNLLESTYQFTENRKFDTNHKYNVVYRQFTVTGTLKQPLTTTTTSQNQFVDTSQNGSASGSQTEKKSNGILWIILALFGIKMLS